MKKSKNKISQSVVWPTTTFFTILPNDQGFTDLQGLNKKFINITLRVRLTNAIVNGKVAEIGSIPGGKGRPLKVFAFTPITRIILDKAKAEGINPVDNADKLLNVISVMNNTPTAMVNPVAISSAVTK